MSRYAEFKELTGTVLKSVDVIRTGDDDSITFTLEDGRVFKLYHEQDCCENVNIEDISGDFTNMIGETVAYAEECSNNFDDDAACEGETWTFYRIRAGWQHVTIRWYGTSNGYYSELVDFKEITEE